MGESLSSWLSLRQAADTRARSVTLTRAIGDALPTDVPLRILDLGSGTGANIRYLAPRLRGPQEWLAVDRDAALLDEIPSAPGSVPFDCRIETRQRELGALDRDLFAGRQLVTASALLDLVSIDWIDGLAARCRDVGAAVLFALSYDGRSVCTPREPEDDAVLAWFNRHQRESDKGFGRAAGPDAARAAIDAFAAAGYDVRHEHSDWVLAPDDSALQRELIEGWASAVVEIVPEQSALVEAWRARRLAHVNEGRSHIVVGHEDVAGWISQEGKR